MKTNRNNGRTPSRKKKFSYTIAMKIMAATLGVLIVLFSGAGIYYKTRLNLMPDADAIFQGEAEMSAQEIYAGVTAKPDIAADSIEQGMLQELEALGALGSEAGGDGIAEETEAPVISDKNIVQMKGVKNYLVIGVDSRSNNFRGRSDVIMILSVNSNTNKINMLSLLRSTSVDIPGRGWDSLNHSYAYGGANLLRKTIETNFRFHIDDHVVFNFSAFRKCIDALGGVKISVTGSEARIIGLPGAGTYNLSGSQALAYSRIRSIDSDFQRTGRQRKVVNATLNKLKSSGVGKLNAVVNATLPNVSTSLSHSQITSLLSKAGSYLSYGRQELLIPTSGNRSRYFNRNGHEMWSYKVTSTVNQVNNFLYK